MFGKTGAIKCFAMAWLAAGVAGAANRARAFEREDGFY